MTGDWLKRPNKKKYRNNFSPKVQRKKTETEKEKSLRRFKTASSISSSSHFSSFLISSFFYWFSFACVNCECVHPVYIIFLLLLLLFVFTSCAPLRASRWCAAHHPRARSRVMGGCWRKAIIAWGIICDETRDQLRRLVFCGLWLWLIPASILVYSLYSRRRSYKLQPFFSSDSVSTTVANRN